MLRHILSNAIDRVVIIDGSRTKNSVCEKNIPDILKKIVDGTEDTMEM